MNNKTLLSPSRPLARTMALTLLCALGQTTQAQTVSHTAVGDVQLAAQGARLSTAGLGETNLSGHDALWIDDLELSLGLASGSLGLDAYEGSALQVRVNSATPFALRFSWQLSSDQASSLPGFDDRAFVLIDGQRFDLASWQGQGQFQHQFTQLGTHTISVGLVDVGDVAGVSQLQLSGLTVSPVPEPQSAALLALGLAGLAAWRRRR